MEIFRGPYSEQSEEGLERFSRVWEEIWEERSGAFVWRMSVGLSGNSMEFYTLWQSSNIKDFDHCSNVYSIGCL